MSVAASRPGVASLRRRRHDAIPFRTVRSSPLLRSGYVLTFSSMTTGVIGFVFWALSAHFYDASTVGRNSTAVSAMMFLGGVSQLNLMSALARFVPISGRGTRRLVLWMYGASVGVALVMAVTFVAFLHELSPRLTPLLDSHILQLGFVLATMAWTIFVLQDAVLTGMHKTPWVALENAVFAGLKLVLVVALVGFLPRSGVFVSWALALGFALVMTNAYLFKRAIPAHELDSMPMTVPLSLRQITRYSSFDYIGALFWIAATTLVPVLVINEVGATASAYFIAAWLIAYSLYLVSANMGTSLVVETAIDPSALPVRCREVISHTLKLMVLGAGAVFVSAPRVLALFGPGYARAGTGVLRLLALSAIPNAVTATAVACARAQLRTTLAVKILAAICGTVLITSALLLPRVGVIAVGIAWLATQTVVATALLARSRIWLPARSTHDDARASGAVWVRRVRGRVVPLLGPAVRLPGVAEVRGLVHRGERARQQTALLGALSDIPRLATMLCDERGTVGRSRVRALDSETDLGVAVIETADAIVKVPRSGRAAAQLAAQQRVLEALHGDARLGEWRCLLPVAEEHPGPAGTMIVVETLLPGVDGRAHVARSNPPEDHFEIPALAAIVPLHRLDARVATVGSDLLSRWLDASLGVLTALPAVVLTREQRASALDLLTDHIREELTGWRTLVGWTHGDYAPGNIRFCPSGGGVVGVVDWADGRSDGCPIMDLVLMLLTSDCLRARREVGDAVVRAVDTRWLRGKLGVLARAFEGPLDGVEARQDALMALCWIQHVAGNVGRSERYERNKYWIAVNVDRVLRRLCPDPLGRRARVLVGRQ